MGLIDIIIARGDGPVLTGGAEIDIAAPRDRVYALVSDITRMGEWSPECYRCEWMDDAAGPAPGARFRGYNRRGWLRWNLSCRITAVEPGKVFAFETTPLGRFVQTRWRYSLEPAPEGTRLRESFEVLWYFRVVFGLGFGGRARRTRQLEEGLRASLARIKAVAEGEYSSQSA